LTNLKFYDLIFPKRRYTMKKILALLALTILFSGCVTSSLTTNWLINMGTHATLNTAEAVTPPLPDHPEKETTPTAHPTWN
jgi:hypothetical protein